MSHFQLWLGGGGPDRWAKLSDCTEHTMETCLPECAGRLYRYDLGERWAEGWILGFVLLNPSTATAETDDPTKTRCRIRAREAGAGGFAIVNLFGLRSRDPGALLTAPDPVGPENDEHLVRRAKACKIVVAGWGHWGGKRRLRERAPAVRRLLEAAGVELHVLRLTGKRQPEHPLFVPYDVHPVRWSEVER